MENYQKIKFSNITKKQYEEILQHLGRGKPFEYYLDNWGACFKHYLKRLELGYNDRIINSLFFDFCMSNWRALHKENTQYKSYSKKRLLSSFVGECGYISDRTSYDRLFRTHWLFKQVFSKELERLMYEF